MAMQWLFGTRAASKSTNDGPPPRKWPSVRISGIPPDIPEQHLRESLSILAKDGKSQLLSFSFCAHGDSNIATATFDVMPPKLQLGYITLQCASSGIEVEVDDNFLGLTPLYSSAGDPTVDIIAVTGLAGHAFGSWRSRQTGQMWLRDWLPKAVPTARILTYGYDTTLIGGQSNASVLEFATRLLEAIKTVRSGSAAQRPLVFIGHSLGGLIIKQLLVAAKAGGRDDRNIVNSCYGLMLFAVPSRGLDNVVLKSLVKGQPNEALVRDLGPDSRFLGVLHESFRRDFLFQDSQIVCIHETRPTPTVEIHDGSLRRTGPKVMMVERSSAIHHANHEREEDILSIDADYFDIVKFSSSNVDPYKMVEHRIQLMVTNAPEIIKRRTEKQNQSDRDTLYIFAKLSNAEGIRNHLRSRCSIDVVGTDGLSALHLAAKRGEAQALGILLECGADIESRSKGATIQTALHFAAENHKYTATKTLLSHGADTNSRTNRYQRTALHLAAAAGYNNIIQALAENDRINFEAKDSYGGTALHSAAWHGNASTVELLLDKGANIEAGDNYGGTPFFTAAGQGRNDVVKLLILRGANIHAQHQNEGTAEQSLASSNRHSSTLLLIRTAIEKRTR